MGIPSQKRSTAEWLRAALVGVMWFTMLNGVGTAAAYGGPNKGTVESSLIQDQRDQPPVNTCLLPWIPC